MTQYHDNKYLELIQYVLDNGTWKENRTGTKTLSVFDYQMKFDLRDGTIPLLTTKKMHIRSIVHELLWYLMGTGDTQYLHDNNVTIWDEWTDEDGQLGRVYGVQWRGWRAHQYNHTDSNIIGAPIFNTAEIDQIATLINKLKHTPDDRRLIISAWNVAELDEMALPPCHYTFQCYVSNGELSMKLHQRSCDVGLGVPFNIVQYSLLLRMLAQVTGLTPGFFIWDGGDVHIYENHIEQLREQLTREPYPSPKFSFAVDRTDIDTFEYDDFAISDYEAHPVIKMLVSA